MTYLPKKALEVARVVMSRRHVELSEEDIKIMEHLFEETKKYRNF